MSYDPNSPPGSAASRPSLTASDDSSLLELSFGYEFDSDGKLVRVSKPGARTSSPPTPADSYASAGGKDAGGAAGNEKGSASPVFGGFNARVDALTRSTALLSTQDHSSDPAQPSLPSSISASSSRQFGRTASTPAAFNVVQRPVRVQRTTLDRHDEFAEELASHRQPTDGAYDQESRPSPPPPIAGRYMARSASISTAQPPQMLDRRSQLDTKTVVPARRVGREKSYSTVDLPEGTAVESDADVDTGAPSVHSRSESRHRSYGMVDAVPPSLGGVRPRRSASFSESPSDEPPPVNAPQSRPPVSYPQRSQSSLDAYQGVNRMPPRQYADDWSDAEPRNGRTQAASPTIPQDQPIKSSTSRAHLQHTRKDSETLQAYSRASPTARNMAPGDPSEGRAPSALSNRGTHPRRAPSAPNAGHSPGIDPDGRQSRGGWTDENGGRHPVAPRSRTPYDLDPSPPSATALTHAASQPALAHAPSQTPAAPPQRTIVVNKRCYVRLDLVGKGGSSRVYRVMSDKNEILAIKRVSLEKADPETLKGYMNEIGLLKRLAGNNRIIRLVDSEARLGAGGGKGHLHLVMECGEIDLARLLQDQQKKPMNLVWIAYYWEQMLDAVHVIHEEKIVHSDLKPANFVLVRGQLKLIDFGIANAIANDTTNIQRDHQIGTVNYMSPEAIEVPEGMRRLKVGRPSDVWSLGCILYQMVYGHPPFFHLNHVVAKMRAIPDPSHVIDFPEWSMPSEAALPALSTAERTRMRRRVRRDVITSMKACLCRNPKERATIPELLQHEWLAMKEPEQPSQPDVHSLFGPKETLINPFYMHQLLMYGIGLGRDNQGEIDEKGLLEEAERLVIQLKQIQNEAESAE